MTQVLPTAFDTAFTNQERKPVILLKLVLDPVVRISNHNVTYNGNIYTKAGVAVKNLRMTTAGIQTIQLEWVNEDYAYTAELLEKMNQLIKITVRLAYGDGPFEIADSYKIFTGELVRPRRLDDIVAIDAATIAPASIKSPWITAGPPEINFLPFPGETFVWEGAEYTVTK